MKTPAVLSAIRQVWDNHRFGPTLTMLCLTVFLAGCSLSARPKFREDMSVPAVVPTRGVDADVAPVQPPSVAHGAQLYAQKCQACHGTNGAGDGPNAARLKAQGKLVANLIDPARARAAKPSDWHNTITNGRIQNLMPPFSGSLNAQDRWDVQSYLWAMGTTSQTLQSGADLFAQQCTGCHTGDGSAPRLDKATWMAGVSLQQVAGAMAAGAAHQALKLNETQRFQIADFVRALSYQYADPAALRDATTKGDGTIIYRAVQAASPAAPLSGAVVTLRAYDQTSEVFSRTQPLDANGVVTFSALPRRADYFYQSEALYDKVKFFAAPQQFLVTDTQIISDELHIYSITDDPSVISIPEFYYFVQDIHEGELSIAEVYNFANRSAQAYIDKNFPGGPRGLRIDVPEDAQNLRFDPAPLAARFTISGSSVYYNDITEPGGRTQQFILLYEIPYRRQKHIERRMTYPVSSTNVVLPDLSKLPSGLQVVGLTDRGVTQTPNGNIHLYISDKPIAAQGSLIFDIRGQPRAAALPGSDIGGIVFGVAGVIVALGLGYLLAMRLRSARAIPVNVERQQLLGAIAQLDDAYAKGDINERAYTRRRAELKAQLKDIWE